MFTLSKTKTDRVLIHGDFHHYNLFFDNHSKVSGIIDWDLVHHMPPAYEISFAWLACTCLIWM
ncbi:aminoglycoside phosphotransferase family protein [Vibrio chagasii]|nr:aminoglycoside phosphotransferase family protein [Vibrio chagasii]